MKLVSAAFAAFALLAASVNGSPMLRMEAEGGKGGIPKQGQQQSASSSSCNLTGTYKKAGPPNMALSITLFP
ncbi:hypothetical protein PR003_g32535 [Phytophthora rubi]|nr:hypothetical protein PR003_g32535 [Phytophthora rubi]